MAFANKIGNFLKQARTSNLSIYQAIRCMSSSKLFIGGLSYSTDDNSLREAFASYGEVVEARVIVDRDSGRSRGFGFVTFTSSEEAQTAMSSMDGKDLHGRMVRVNYANERTGGFRGGGGYGGGGYGGYGGGSGSYGGGYGGGSGSYGGGYGGDSYNSGGGYGGGNYSVAGADGGSNSSRYGGDSYNSRGGYGGGNYSVAGADGGSNSSYVTDAVGGNTASAGGFGGSGSVGYGSGGSDPYDGGQSSAGVTNEKEDDMLDAHFKDDDDDEPDDYANKRA